MAEIRPTTADDWQSLKDVRMRALADAPYAFSETLDQAVTFPESMWRSRASGRDSVCALAWNGDQPVGMAVGLPDEDQAERAYLVSMWVAPSERGGSTGPALVEAVVQWCRNRGIQVLVAGVTSRNHRALAFYRKLGFAPYQAQALSHRAVTGCREVLALGL